MSYSQNQQFEHSLPSDSIFVLDLPETGQVFLSYINQDISQCNFSPNNKYAIAWDNYAGKCYIITSPQYSTKPSIKAISKAKSKSLENAYIANNGTCLLEYWKDSNEPSGEIVIKSKENQTLYSKRFKLNIFNSTISENGLFATIQFCNGYEEFAGQLVIIDMRNDISVTHFTPETGWADSYMFDCLNNTVTLKYKEGQSYKYKLSGDLLEKEKYHLECEKSYMGYDAYKAAKRYADEISSSNIADYDYCLKLLYKALSNNASITCKANTYKLLSEIQLRCGNKLVAITALKQSLSIKPTKAGKARLVEIEKQVGILQFNSMN